VPAVAAETVSMLMGSPSMRARDALLNGQLGVLVDPDDVTGFVDTAVQVLKGQHPNRMIYDPRALRLRVIERYGPEKFFSRLGEILGSRGLQGGG
jgi:hypothetical protein